MTWNACIIGCGYIAKKHLDVIAKMNHLKLHSLCDINPQKTKEAEKSFLEASETKQDHQIKHYTEIDEVLKNNEIDVVIITTISHLHASLAKKALLAGKHVILEKPMSLSLEEGKELCQLSKDKKKILLICHQLRYRPLFQQIKKLLDEGTLGKPYLGVVSIQIHRSEKYYETASWRGTWDLDGGMLMNQGIHLIDLLQWFLGDVDSVFGEISKGKIKKETEDCAVGIVTFKNNALGVIEANTVTLPKNIGYSISLFCENGTISIDGPSFNNIRRWYIQGRDSSQPPKSMIEDTNDRQYMYEDFMKVIEKKKEDLTMNGMEGMKAIETIFSLYESARTKKRITLPLPKFHLSRMKEAE